MKRIILAAIVFVLAGPFIAGCEETTSSEKAAPMEKTASTVKAAAEHPSDHPTEHPK